MAISREIVAPPAWQPPISREIAYRPRKGTEMFWVQLSTFLLFNLLIIAMLATQIPLRSFGFTAGQHAGRGDGEYTVWHLIADVEAERRAAAAEVEPIPVRFPTEAPDDPPTGRHHLRV
ncbi:hypothetical protein ABT337_20165 [Saccharopolyspora hirsuta]|nr:hypothetical protein [Saccharopolyspora hirsuta]